MNNTPTANRILWVDVLRLVAMLMVIAAHCTDMYNASPQAILASTTKCSFVAYLMHYAIIGPVILVILPLGLPTPLSILCSVVAVFGICWGLTALIYKIAPKWAKYIVG